MTCTFFGHRNSPREVIPELKRILLDLIENKGVKRFFVGNHGNFDRMVRKQLTELKKEYPINVEVVLAYLPDEKNTSSRDYDIQTIFPEGIERVPKKFAINFRNEWMIKKSDYVVTYVKYSVGGAFKFKEYAEMKKKEVINIEV